MRMRPLIKREKGGAFGGKKKNRYCTIIVSKKQNNTF